MAYTYKLIQAKISMEGEHKRKKQAKKNRLFEKDVLYFLSGAFSFLVARNETDREAYCFSLSNK